MRTLQRAPRAAREVRSVGWSKLLGIELSFRRKLRRMLVAAAIIGPVALTPELSSAQGLLDFFFGGGQKQQDQDPFFANVFRNDPQPPPPARPVVSGSGPAFCVRTAAANIFR